jgi:hypothetical protein
VKQNHHVFLNVSFGFFWEGEKRNLTVLGSPEPALNILGFFGVLLGMIQFRLEGGLARK